MAKNLLQQVLNVPDQSLNLKKFMSDIDRGYTADRETKFLTKKSFSPSKLVYGEGACPRYWYLAFSGADFEDNVDAYAAANMRSGIDGHERIQTAIENAGIMVEKEKRIVAEDPPIFGFADAIVQIEEEQPVVEIKTMRDESFTYRKNAKPPSYHLMQLIIYMKVLGKRFGVLLYENKNSHELHSITVEAQPEYVEWVDYAFNWMRQVYRSFKEGILPQKAYRSNSKICKNCVLATTCAASPKGDIKIERLNYL